MDDKENVHYKQLKSKIPLPINPLPPVPEKLRITRVPLKTINIQAESTKTSNQNKKPTNCDTSHVKRKNEEKLDYLVFLDIPLDYNVNADDDKGKENQITQSNAISSTQNDLTVKASTPVAKPTPIEINRIKNIKKSLNRPHSRELQGLSPLVRDKKRVEDGVKRRLSFVDPLKQTSPSPDKLTLRFRTNTDYDYTEDILEYLQRIEKKPPQKCEPTKLNRACVVNWLMKVNGPHGDPAIMQAACWYLDQIQAKYDVAIDKLQLVATSCFWIAQKLYQSSVPATRLVRCANSAFASNQLVYIEMMVLNLLKFPTQPVVPQDFTYYLSWYCDNLHPSEIEQASTFFLACGLLLNNVHDCPSVLAAAAVKNALLCLKKKNLIAKLESCPTYQRAVAKAHDFKRLCSSQRIAVSTISHPHFEYRVPFEHFDSPPFYVAWKVVEEVRLLANKRAE